MWFSRSKRSIFPLLPPYGAHNPQDGRIIPLHPDGLTPYLGLRARLSQVWINRWTILILLILVRLILAVGNIRSDMASAKREALSACTSVESVGSAMASMPHYLAQGVNELVADSVTDAVAALVEMLDLAITATEELILFVVKMMYQTYLCLITLAVHVVVDVAVDLIEDVVSAVNETIQDVEKGVKGAVSTFENGLDDIIDDINDLGFNIPTLNLSSWLSDLDDWSIPSSVTKDLDALNNSIPSFSTVEKVTESIIESPFEDVKKLLDNAFGSYKFDSSLLDVPGKKKLTFCNDNDGIDSFFNGVTDVVLLARKIFIIVLVIAAVLACIPSAWQEIRRWRHMKERSQLVRREAHDPMDVVYIVSRPHTSAIGIRAASRFSNSRRQTLVRWAVAYATSLPALFVLALAIASLLACLFQWIIIHEISKEVPALSAEVGEFAEKVVGALQNASIEWADTANGYIKQVDNDINDNMLGWVNTTTTAINDTLNSFVNEVDSVINDTFGGTILEKPIEEIFNCLIGLKVKSIEEGLTWVHDHAHVNITLFPDDIFSKGANESISNGTGSDSFLSEVGDTTSNEISQVVVDALDILKAALKQETIIAACVFGLWVVILLMGFIRALFLWWQRDKNRGEGGGHALDPVPNHPPPRTDAHDFDDVPLTAMPKAMSGAGAAAPAYEASVSHSTVIHNNPFNDSNVIDEKQRSASRLGVRGRVNPFHDAHAIGDEKHGFAGERTAQQVHSESSWRMSRHVEYDTKS
ncbi:Plasma membrane fusion protein prm1 [Penicillium herquei]|nr:Plasma membrane fusion protein prm1 [Penicillium herquei]